MSDWKKLREIAETVATRNRSVKRGHPKYTANVSSAEEVALTDGVLALLDENDSLRAEVERLRASVSAHGEALRYIAYCAGALSTPGGSWKGDDQDHSNAEEIAAGNMVIGEDGKAIGKDGGNG